MAKNDLLVARELVQEKHFVYRAILMHSQQSIEKYLKAFLLFHNTAIIRTHDLLTLCKTCENYDQAFLPFEEDLAWVSVNYVHSRYPDEFEDITFNDATRALSIARQFENFILPKYNLPEEAKA
ncbi:MAG: HEPN domain-containing protein [Bacteroidota bacterium]|nr:HEPN domain-containing protein [Bacteroidota bacterium]